MTKWLPVLSLTGLRPGLVLWYQKIIMKIVQTASLLGMQPLEYGFGSTAWLQIVPFYGHDIPV